MFLARVRQLVGGRPLLVVVWLMCLAMLAMDVFTSPVVTLIRVVVWVLLALGVVVVQRWAWAGCVIEVCGLLLATVMGGGYVGVTLYAPLVALTVVVVRRRVWPAAALTAVGLLSSVWLSWVRADGSRECAEAVVVWAVLYAVAWALGRAVRVEQGLVEQDWAEQIAAQRRQIATELHDNLAHDLVDIVMLSEQARMRVPAAATELELIAGRARRSNEHLRSLMTLLRVGEMGSPQSLETTWLAAVHDLDAAGFTVSADDLQVPDDLRPAATDAAARIVKEAVNNALRHGRPGPCTLEATFTAREMGLRVVNVMSGPRGDDRLGLIGMRERVEALNGSFRAGPMDNAEAPGTEGAVWEVAVRLPV